MDVVYNHTSASGQDPQSVLDRIVPGYYHRLDAQRPVETSTCCDNTATEHRMMAQADDRLGGGPGRATPHRRSAST
jgi:pullulanase